MNRHFKDARYYLKRTSETAGKGLKAELEPVEARFREFTGAEAKPEPTRLEAVKADLRTLQYRLEGKAQEAIAHARERVENYRGNKPVET